MEVAERFAYYGLAGNLIMYLTNELHLPTATAAKNVNMWIGLSSLFPILGAIVADSYLGRFKTIIYSTCIYFLVYIKKKENNIDFLPGIFPFCEGYVQNES